MARRLFVAVGADDKTLDLPAVEVGADYEVQLVVKVGVPSEATPIESLPNMVLTGYQAFAQARQDVTDATLLLNLSSIGNDGIQIDTAAGSLWLFVPASKTRTIQWTAGVYDILLKAPAAPARGDGIIKLCKGQITAELGATQIEGN